MDKTLEAIELLRREFSVRVGSKEIYDHEVLKVANAMTESLDAVIAKLKAGE